MTLIEVWTLYTVIGASSFAAVFVWAVRARQFSELQRQSRMALDAEPLIEEERTQPPGKADRYTAAALFALALLAIAAVMLTGWRMR